MRGLSNLPPGCTNADIERAFGGGDPSPESERIGQLIDERDELMRKGWSDSKDEWIEERGVYAKYAAIIMAIDAIVDDRNSNQMAMDEYRLLNGIYERGLTMLREVAHYLPKAVQHNVLTYLESVEMAQDQI